MITEIMSNEKKETKSPSLENYKNIKPENPMTTGEANDFWKSEFKNVADDSRWTGVSDLNQPKQYLDDNGKLFRDKDHLFPNMQYEVNGYNYETDEKGRIVSAEGKLRLCETDYKRNMENVRQKEGQEYKESDEKGHIIGHQFGGSDKLENLVPMDAQLNHGDFVKLEKTLADAVRDKADVRLKVEPVYEKDSTRPSEFKVSYSIDGDRETTVFRNERVE